MAKTNLLSYKQDKINPLQPNVVKYVLTLQKSYFFWFKKPKVFKTKFKLPIGKKPEHYFEIWDRQIKNKTQLYFKKSS